MWCDRAALMEPVAINPATETVICLVTLSPAELVTVNVNVVVVERVPVLTDTPLAAPTFPVGLLIVPVPPVKTGVKVVLPPGLIGLAAAVKLAIWGAATTVTWTCLVTEAPSEFWSDRV